MVQSNHQKQPTIKKKSSSKPVTPSLKTDILKKSSSGEILQPKRPLSNIWDILEKEPEAAKKILQRKKTVGNKGKLKKPTGVTGIKTTVLPTVPKSLEAVVQRKDQLYKLLEQLEQSVGKETPKRTKKKLVKKLKPFVEPTFADFEKTKLEMLQKADERQEIHDNYTKMMPNESFEDYFKENMRGTDTKANDSTVKLNTKPDLISISDKLTTKSRSISDKLNTKPGSISEASIDCKKLMEGNQVKSTEPLPTATSEIVKKEPKILSNETEFLPVQEIIFPTDETEKMITSFNKHVKNSHSLYGRFKSKSHQEMKLSTAEIEKTIIYGQKYNFINFGWKIRYLN
jgi:hypothetical protein